MLITKVGASFKSAPPMTSDESDRTWDIIKNAIHQIHAHNGSSLSFEELYRSAYNLVIHKFGMKLYTGVGTVVRDHLEGVSGRISLSGGDEAFLMTLLAEWTEHQLVMRMIRDVLMYMDRNFVRQYNLPDTIDVGRKLFQTRVILNERITVRFIDGLLNLIDQHRLGTCRDPTLIPSLVSILTESSKGRDCENLYVTLFVDKFIRRADEYYTLQASALQSGGDASMFVTTAIAAYACEAKLIRSGGFDADATLPAIFSVLDKAWILTHHEYILTSSFVPALRSGNVDLLKSMCYLFSKTEVSRKRMLLLFREELFSTMCGEDKHDVVASIGRVNKLNGLIKQAQLTKEFSMEMKGVLEDVFALDSGAGISKRLAEYFDDIVRKQTKSLPGPELEQFISDGIMLFQYVSSKDVFEAWYRLHLSKRLLAGSRLDAELEQTLVNKLKLECGTSYTTKIEGMIADISNSAEMSAHWRASGSELCELIDAKVLTSSLWSNVKAFKVNVPSPMGAMTTGFEAFYATRYSERRLTWIYSQGTADVRSRFDAGTSLLTVSSIQAMVLLLFNEAESISVEQMVDSLGVGVADLNRHLLSLFVNPKFPILERLGHQATRQSMLEPSSTFRVNPNFELPKLKHVKVPLIVDTHAAPELTGSGTPGDMDTGAGIEQVVEEDRKHLIEAALVRVMKTRRQLDHSNLIAEVAKILSQRFTPSVQMIKSRIDNLIDREFIARDNDDLKLYYYVA